MTPDEISKLITEDVTINNGLSDETSIGEMIAQIDTLLTGSSSSQSYPVDEEDIIDKMEGMVYLSDGGYSRIYLKPVNVGSPDESVSLVLGSESTDKVKEKWNTPEVQSLVGNVNARVARKYRELLDGQI